MNADLDRETGTIAQGDISLGKAVARLTGGFQSQGETQVVNLKLSAPDMSVDELEAMLPALGIVLPSGSNLKGGTLSTDLAITGPLDKLVIAGPVRMSNTRLVGFDMGSKLGAVSAFSGKAPSSPDTTIENASLNAHRARDDDGRRHQCDDTLARRADWSRHDQPGGGARFPHDCRLADREV